MPTLPLHPAIVHVPLGLALVLPLLAVTVGLAVWRGRLPGAPSRSSSGCSSSWSERAPCP